MAAVTPGPAPRSEGAMAKTSTGRAMFLNERGPSAWKSAFSARLTWSNTWREMQMPPGSAMPSSRAATLMPSP